MLPDGTVTLLFTDVESSTRHLLRLGDRYPAVLDRHRQLVMDAVHRHHGMLVDHQGDTTFAAFASAHHAVLAAIEGQDALATEPWPGGEPVRARMGIHTGEPSRRADGYAGLDVHRAARICAAAHGGQVVISQTARSLVAHALPPDTALLDLGRHYLKDLPQPEHLLQVVGRNLQRDFPPLRSLGAPAGLPPHRQHLFGREEHLEAYRRLVLQDDIRLVTLTGPGGTGKTALAVHLAAALMPHFEDGVAYVSLAPIADPDLVPRAISRALGIQQQGGQPLLETLTDALSSRHSLLVLDNFEHVLPAAPVLTELIVACPKLKIVATSRELLRLSHEYDVAVPPLRLPEFGSLLYEQIQQNDAVQLFVARAQEVRPSFTLTEENASVIVEICRRLDGLPLALELAAARVRLLPPRALLARLDRRLPMLTDGPRDLPARQRTLRDTIGWSYGLLSEPERRLFRALGVFVDGGTLDAIEALVRETPGTDGSARTIAEGAGPVLSEPPPETLDLITSLVDKSLVRQSVAQAEPRFSLLETIREFALEQLDAAGEAAEVHGRHADYFLRLAELADPHLITGQQVRWLGRLEAEHGNLSAALSWTRDAAAAAIETPAGIPAGVAGLRLAGALHWFWWLGGHVAEGAQRLTEVLSRPDQPNDRPARLRALYAAGTLAMIQGTYNESLDLLDAGFRLAEGLGDPVTAGRCLAYRGIVETYFLETGKFTQADALRTAWEAVEILARTDDTWGQALAISQIGAHARRDGDYAESERLLVQAVDLARTTGERYLLGSCLPKLGNLYIESRDFAAAEPQYRDALVAFRAIRENWWTGRCVHYLALAAAGRGEYLRAALLIGGSDAILEHGGARRNPSERQRYEQLLIQLPAELGPDVFRDTYDRGHQLSVEAVVNLALMEPIGIAPREAERL
ncbi:MAG: AAA family ATPase [Chloroflexota bacterium]